MKLYIIERKFFDNNINVIKVYDHGLKPMTHKEAINVLASFNNEKVYDKYNCIDALREISLSEIINERYPEIFSDTNIIFESENGDYIAERVLEVLDSF